MRLKISIIVAVADNGVIGDSNSLPWYLPADLRHFKETTMGHPIIMGRKTYESIGRALPGRHNIILTRDSDFKAEGCTVVNSFDQALKAAGDIDEVFVIGGANIYEQALPLASQLYLTEVHAHLTGDTYFRYNRENWHEVARQDFKADQQNPHPYSFVVLERKPV